MTSEAEDSADPWVTAMPAALAAVLLRYDAATRRTAIANWTAIGDQGQQDYDRYVDRALFSWTRRRRGRRLARRLITGIE
ncbi:MAG TPA: hypothetical protein VHZ96_19760 [Frankiaceae bacterium]|jgi:hypothetical protein|nr:hypothetical protein [Frankiaceae bacterium]